MNQQSLEEIAANRLALDFVNLAFAPGDPTPRQVSWPQLIDFLTRKKIVSPERTEQLEVLPNENAAAAQTLLVAAEELSDAMRQCFRCLLRGRRIAPEWVEPINRILRVTEGHDELEWDGNQWRLGFVAKDEGLEWLLASIARSGAELIAEGPTGNLRQCDGARCELLYYDDSETHRRRWCAMSVCGNRSKVAAFTRRRGGLKARAHHA